MELKSIKTPAQNRSHLEIGDRTPEDGDQKLKMEVGTQKIETGSWKMETVNWKIETGGRRMEPGTVAEVPGTGGLYPHWTGDDFFGRGPIRGGGVLGLYS